MRWDDFRQSENVEDRRGEGDGFGGGFGMPVGRGGLGLGTILVLGLVGWAMGVDPRQLIGMVETMQGGGYVEPYDRGTPQQRDSSATANDRDIRFVRAIVGNTEDVWKV